VGRLVRGGGVWQAPVKGKVSAKAGEAEVGLRQKSESDTYLLRIAKYIPAEIVAFFIFVNSILGEAIAKGSASMAHISVTAIAWAALLLGFAMTPLYLLAQRDPTEPDESPGLNITMALFAFPVWAYAVDAVAFRPWHDGALASIVLATFSVISGAISPKLVASMRTKPETADAPPGQH
jgi:hypothetical protein